MFIFIYFINRNHHCGCICGATFCYFRSISTNTCQIPLHIYHQGFNSSIFCSPLGSCWAYSLHFLILISLMHLLLFEDITSKQLVTALWYHECMRVFQDRLVDFDDRFKFNMIINSIFNASNNIRMLF